MGLTTHRTVLFLALLVGSIAPAAFAQADTTPEVTFKDLTGTERRISEHKGKITVVNFWATWCLPCRHELPVLDKLAKKYADADVTIVAISIDDPQRIPKIPEFLKKRKVELPVWTGATPETLKQFQMGEIVPATLILDRAGQPVSRIMGEASRRDIASRIDWLLKGKTGKAPKAVEKNY